MPFFFLQEKMMKMIQDQQAEKQQARVRIT
jgi:hypothetical protein